MDIRAFHKKSLPDPKNKFSADPFPLSQPKSQGHSHRRHRAKADKQDPVYACVHAGADILACEA